MMQSFPLMQVLEYRLPPGMRPLVEDPSLHQLHPYAGTPGVACAQNTVGTDVRERPRCWSAALRKYVILCTACGGMAALLGALFLLVHFVLRAHTSSLHYFETVPTYVPAAMLTVTGLVVMCFARRRNRYGYLIKVCGVCCLLCAVLCVVVTVTTTVIHMNRLQLLRQCVYEPTTQACTCYSGLQPPAKSSSAASNPDDDLRFVFHNTTDCEVVHGALYSCLRALFGLSVIGILVCIFSCMLVYQLLSHEKKKMYWEQLEMRCRYLYGRGRAPQYALCGCSCDECPRFPPSTAATATTPHAEMFPWPGGGWEQQGGYLDDRYWNPRVGNLYTPSPDEAPTQSTAVPAAAPTNARWSWLPWHRNTCRSGGETSAETPADTRERPHRGDPDSQYGFGAAVRPGTVQLAPRTVGSQVVPICRPLASHAFVTESSAGLPRYMWGPPPPYSQPPSSSSNSSSTSPSRHPDPMQMHSCYTRQHMSPGHHHHHHHHLVHCSGEGASHPGSPQHQAGSPAATTPTHMPHSPPTAARRSVTGSPCCARIRNDDTLKLELQPSCGGGGNNTLPSRKPKKRPSENSPSPLKSNPQPQVDSSLESPGRKQGAGLASSLRGLFGAAPNSSPLHNAPASRNLMPQSAPNSATSSPHKTALAATTLSPLRRLPPTPCMLQQMRPAEPTESEVYFADVSSCNGGPDSSLYDEPNAPELPAERYLPRATRYAGGERLAPDAQYEPPRVSAAPQVAEDDAPMRDSDATIDSGVHSGSELQATAASTGRVVRPPLMRADAAEQQQTTRSVNV